MVRIDLQYEDHEIPALIAALEGFCAEIVPHGRCTRCGTTKQEKTPITDEQKTQILEMHAAGKSIPEIKVALMIEDGRQIQGVIMGKRRRKETENVAPPQVPPETVLSPTAEAKPPEVQSPRPPIHSARPPPEPKALSRAEVDDLIWNAWKAGETPEEISEDLQKDGIPLITAAVRGRLIRQGAKW